MKDPYDVLGVRRDATPDDIRKAFRRGARERHPDTQPDNPWAEEDFRELAAAYELLSDPDRRARYDRGETDAAGNPRRRRRGPFGGGFRRKANGADPESGRDAGKARGNPIKIKGADVSYDCTVAFLDAARGVTTHIETTNGRRLAVKVPPGTTDGQMLRLKGQGLAGIGGGGAGDALVEIRVEPHPTFHSNGRDVRVDLPVTLPEAVLGARIEAPTIDGPVTVTVPPGANTGTVLRLRGKGLAGAPDGRGDQYVTLRVVLPSKPDSELAAFVERWAAKHPYQVRGTDG